MRKCLPLILLFLTPGYAEHQEPLLAIQLEISQTDFLSPKVQGQETLAYDLIYDKGKPQTLETFTSDGTPIASYGASDLFNSDILNAQAYLTYVGDSKLYTPKEVVLFKAMAKTIDHSLMGYVHVFENPTRDKVYAYYDLNVNWQAPSYLLEYDIQNKNLKTLGRWDFATLKDVSFAPQETA